MATINKILQVVLFLSLTLLVFCTTFVGIFKSNQQLTQTLDKADFYSFASNLMASQINTQLIGNNQEVELAKQSIEQGVSPQLARAALQPLQISLINWLSSDQDNLRLELDLQAIKAKVIGSVEGADLKFTLTKLIPDQIDLFNTKNIQSGDLESLQKVKTFYKLSDQSIPILSFTVVGVAILLVILNIHKGSKKLTSIFYSTAAATAVSLIVIGLSYPLERMISINSSASQSEQGVSLSIRILIAVIQQTLWYFVIIGLISISGIIISRTLYKKRDKKLKEKKK